MSAAIKMCLVFIVMYPSNKGLRLYASGAAKKREKKLRLDSAVADTSKIRSFFLTSMAGEDETSECNPENSKRDAVDVAPSVPASGVARGATRAKLLVNVFFLQLIYVVTFF